MGVGSEGIQVGVGSETRISPFIFIVKIDVCLLIS